MLNFVCKEQIKVKKKEMYANNKTNPKKFKGDNCDTNSLCLYNWCGGIMSQIIHVANQKTLLCAELTKKE